MKTASPVTAKIPRRRKVAVNPAHAVFELDLWLVDSDPLIWRSFAVPADFTLEQMHYLIQSMMEWEDYHMHRFETAEGRRFESRQQAEGMSQWLGDDDDPSEDEASIMLRTLFEPLKEVLCYLYDYGDDWTHGIKIINTHADAKAFARLPICLAGARSGPPEDCGGVWGYEEKLEILRHPDPHDEWHQEIIEWMGGPGYDPEAFNLEAINHRLKSVVWERLKTPRRPARSKKRRKHKSR